MRDPNLSAGVEEVVCIVLLFLFWAALCNALSVHFLQVVDCIFLNGTSRSFPKRLGEEPAFVDMRGPARYCDMGNTSAVTRKTKTKHPQKRASLLGISKTRASLSTDFIRIRLQFTPHLSHEMARAAKASIPRRRAKSRKTRLSSLHHFANQYSSPSTKMEDWIPVIDGEPTPDHYWNNNTVLVRNYRRPLHARTTSRAQYESLGRNWHKALLEPKWEAERLNVKRSSLAQANKEYRNFRKQRKAYRGKLIDKAYRSEQELDRIMLILDAGGEWESTLYMHPVKELQEFDKGAIRKPLEEVLYN